MGGNGIATLTSGFAEFRGPVASFLKRDGAHRTKSNIAAFAADGYAQHPALRSSRIHAEKQPLTIAIDTGFAALLHGLGKLACAVMHTRNCG